MNFKALEQSLIDVLVEQQLKLGYMVGAVGFYYPNESINGLLGTNIADNDELNLVLLEFKAYTKDRLGDVEISHKKDRFCFMIPAEGAKYVHENIDPGEFLPEFIKLIGTHGVTLVEVEALFKHFSKAVHVETFDGEDFDELLYFEDGKPDDYRYLFTLEGHHVIYHRYSKEDFERLIG